MKPVYKIVIAAAAVLAVAAAAVFLSFKVLYPVKYRDEVNECAGAYGFEPRLIFAVIRTESGFDAKAVSRAGAVGLMQLMPQTAVFISGKAGVKGFETESLYQPSVNILLGCAYLRYLMDRFGNDVRLALYAYNAGEGNVAAWLIDPRFSKDGKTLTDVPFKETKQYYERIMKAEKIYALMA